ncbi:uncharacterized protein H6S33_011614 [Morchella sextelata]|uniref:uncharacterized protein n=1 Tax=Morchella sextelata TaxID=1174677 RepID=UPI001D041584|nr:uncharacterized protein H6S33_011614 [Morchella sextelata]KAH0611187.1 hypothetical protein H6S33_011614 [Morchella sextelata]
MGIRLLSANYSSPPVPPPCQKNDLRQRPSPNPQIFPRVPVEIFHKIMLHVIKLSSRSVRSRRALMLRLSSTCSYLRNLFKNDVYSRIITRSALSLIKFVSYLSVSAWPGQSTALKSLTLCWLQKTQIALESHTEALESLTLDFPGAGVAFQTAILTVPGFVSKQHLKHLRITNGLCLLFQPATDEEYYPPRVIVPGDQMFRTYERLERLKKLQVKGVAGFTDECLAWILGGCQLLNSTRKGNSLILEGCQSLTERGVKRILAGMNENSKTYTRIRYSYVEPVMNKSNVPTPDTWWALFGHDETSTIDDDRTFSFITDDGSFNALARISSRISDTTHEDPDIFESYFDGTGYRSSKRSQGSYPSTYARQRAYTQHFVQQYNREAHICDSTANGCRNLPRLDVPFYDLPCSPSYGYCSSELGNSRSMAPEWVVDEDASYINYHLDFGMTRRTSDPNVEGPPQKPSGDSRFSGLLKRSLSDPLPGSADKKGDRKTMNLNSGDFKRLTMLVEEVPMAKGLRFMSLRGLWEGVGGRHRKCWLRCKMRAWRDTEKLGEK